MQEPKSYHGVEAAKRLRNLSLRELVVYALRHPSKLYFDIKSLILAFEAYEKAFKYASDKLDRIEAESHNLSPATSVVQKPKAYSVN